CLEVKVKRAARHVAEAAAPCPTAPPCRAEGRACLPHPCCERLPAPACCHENHGEKSQDEEIAAFWNTLAEMICGRCPLTQNSWAETTLPSGHYLPYPPQCFPPAPAFPLSRELTYQVNVATACTPASGIMPCAAWKSGPA